MSNYEKLISLQREFFNKNETLSISFRIEQLKKLKFVILKYQEDILVALKKDLGKHALDVWTTEIAYTIQEINLTLKYIKKWRKPIRVPTPFPLWFGRSEIHFNPYGVVLIIGAWNFPFALTMQPLIGCIAAGNCAIIKPSEISSYSQNLVVKMINEHFPEHYLTAIKADPKQTEQLLANKLDYIFFTGSTTIGKKIMEAAAKHLTPITLELGGRNPCIVDETADIDMAAKRIIWAKLLNNGQVCLSPDYLLVHQSCKEALIEQMKKYIEEFYGEDAEKSASYSRIINAKHFDRLIKLLEKGHILCGGQFNKDQLYIAPTLIDQLTLEDFLAQEEIFGPILPIFSYQKIDEVTEMIKKIPYSLALYFFTNNKNHEKKVINELSFGGGCINDCLYHAINPNLPFGGIGQSGTGAYHGKYSFESFSHKKSIFKRKKFLSFLAIYPPFTEKKLHWFKRAFNFLYN